MLSLMEAASHVMKLPLSVNRSHIKIDWLTPQNEGEIDMLSILINELNHKDSDKTMKGV